MTRTLLATILLGGALALGPTGARAQHVEAGPGGIGLHADHAAHSPLVERHLVVDEHQGGAGHGSEHHETSHTTTHEGGRDGDRH